MVLVLTFICSSCSTGPDGPAKLSPSAKVELRFAEMKPGPGLRKAPLLGGKERVFLHDRAELTERDIAEVAIDRTQVGPPWIVIWFCPSGAERLFEVTSSNVGRRLAVVVNGKAIAVATIRDAVPGSIEVRGAWDEDLANEIFATLVGAKKVNTGSESSP